MKLSECTRAQGTLKQRLFIKHYLNPNSLLTFGNGTQSAKLARYKGNNNTLHVVAWENLQKPTVIDLAEGVVNNLLSTEQIESEIAKVAQTETVISEQSKMKALELLTKIKGMVITKTEIDQTVRNEPTDLLAAYIALAAKSGLHLTAEQAQARIDAQLNPPCQPEATDAVN